MSLNAAFLSNVLSDAVTELYSWKEKNEEDIWWIDRCGGKGISDVKNRL